MENVNGISVKELGSLLEKMKKRLSVSNHSEQTIINYLRSVEYLCKHTGKHPQDTEIDEIIDYLYQLQYHKFRAWRTIKIYVAGLRWYYSHILEQEKLAFQIPYPKEEQDLPVVLSRKELFKLFSNFEKTCIAICHLQLRPGQLRLLETNNGNTVQQRFCLMALLCEKNNYVKNNNNICKIYNEKPGKKNKIIIIFPPKCPL